MSTVPAGSPAWHLYVPKLYTVLRLGYGRDDFRHDLIAGLTNLQFAHDFGAAVLQARATP
jgi:SulP family sulfate permease